MPPPLQKALSSFYKALPSFLRGFYVTTLGLFEANRSTTL